MGKEYYHQTVDVILEKESELYRRIAALAEAQGHSFEAEVESVVEASLWRHMMRNVGGMERCVQESVERKERVTLNPQKSPPWWAYLPAVVISIASVAISIIALTAQ